MLKKWIEKIYHALLDLIFPIECLGCGKEGNYLCPDCYKRISTDNNQQPPLPAKIDKILAAASYHDRLVEKAIHNLKFRYLTDLAQPLARLLIDNYERQFDRLSDPLIIPVPLHKQRMLERGFNQSELIAEIFAKHFHYPLSNNAVIRSRQTPHQVGLDKASRKKNVIGAFSIPRPELVQNKNIIIIDDVLTTGATLQEIAKVLKEHEAKEVWALAVAFDD